MQLAKITNDGVLEYIFPTLAYENAITEALRFPEPTEHEDIITQNNLEHIIVTTEETPEPAHAPVENTKFSVRKMLGKVFKI
jgi:hypothetical protein